MSLPALYWMGLDNNHWGRQGGGNAVLADMPFSSRNASQHMEMYPIDLLISLKCWYVAKGTQGKPNSVAVGCYLGQPYHKAGWAIDHSCQRSEVIDCWGLLELGWGLQVTHPEMCHSVDWTASFLLIFKTASSQSLVASGGWWGGIASCFPPTDIPIPLCWPPVVLQ